MAGILDFGPDPMATFGAGLGQGFGQGLENYRQSGIMQEIIGGGRQPQEMMQQIMGSPLPPDQKQMFLQWMLKNEDVKAKVASRGAKQQEEAALKSAIADLTRLPNVGKMPTEQVVSFLADKGVPVPQALQVANMLRMNSREGRINEKGVRDAYNTRRKELIRQIEQTVGSKKKPLEDQLKQLNKAQQRDLRRLKNNSLDALEIDVWDEDGEDTDEIIDEVVERPVKAKEESSSGELQALEKQFPAKSNEGKTKKGPSGSVYKSVNGKWKRIQ